MLHVEEKYNRKLARRLHSRLLAVAGEEKTAAITQNYIFQGNVVQHFGIWEGRIQLGDCTKRECQNTYYQNWSKET